MRKWIVLMLACMLLCGVALAEQTVTLPGEKYSLQLPDEMQFNTQGRSDLAEFQFAYSNKNLEMDVFAYPSGGKTLEEMRKVLKRDGVAAEIRKSGGVEMLCYSMTDEESGDLCAVYSLEDGDQVIEIAFWYTKKSALKQAETIMSTLAEQ